MNWSHFWKKKSYTYDLQVATVELVLSRNCRQYFSSDWSLNNHISWYWRWFYLFWNKVVDYYMSCWVVITTKYICIFSTIVPTMVDNLDEAARKGGVAFHKPYHILPDYWTAMRLLTYSISLNIADCSLLRLDWSFPFWGCSMGDDDTITRCRSSDGFTSVQISKTM